MATRVVAGLTLAVVLAACSAAAEESTEPTRPLGLSESPPLPGPDQDQIELGETLYRQSCASCHRPDLSGDPDWKTANAGGYPPPPHDSTGHTWHHSDEVLITLIRDGSDFPQTRMPTFGQTLSAARRRPWPRSRLSPPRRSSVRAVPPHTCRDS